MKESISGTFLFIIVITLIIVFTCIMTMTINHSRAYAIKDDILAYIENNQGNGINDDEVPDGLVSIISDAGYFTTGSCPKSSENEPSWHGYDRTGKETSSNPAICIKQVYINSNEYMQSKYGSNYSSADVNLGCFYEVRVFYNINLPVISSIFPFSVSGETKTIYNGECSLGD